MRRMLPQQLSENAKFIGKSKEQGSTTTLLAQSVKRQVSDVRLKKPGDHAFYVQSERRRASMLGQKEGTGQPSQPNIRCQLVLNHGRSRARSISLTTWTQMPVMYIWLVSQ